MQSNPKPFIVDRPEAESQMGYGAGVTACERGSKSMHPVRPRVFHEQREQDCATALTTFARLPVEAFTTAPVQALLASNELAQERWCLAELSFFCAQWQRCLRIQRRQLVAQAQQSLTGISLGQIIYHTAATGELQRSPGCVGASWALAGCCPNVL